MLSHIKLPSLDLVQSINNSNDWFVLIVNPLMEIFSNKNREKSFNKFI